MVRQSAGLRQEHQRIGNCQLPAFQKEILSRLMALTILVVGIIIPSKQSMTKESLPVPANKDGKREINGWEFHYNGWTKPSANDEHQF